MKAYITRSCGPDARFELAEMATPEPGAGELTITVRATSLNPIDNKFLRHDLGFNPEFPAVLHGDVAGVVSSIGPDVDGFQVGDAVYACAGGFKGLGGALAECMLADVRLVAPMPTSLDFAEAAALPLVTITAWEGLLDRAGMQPGAHVLVHGGAGGVGHVAIQIAKAHGARVSTTVSSEAKAALARDLGADHTILYHEESVEAYVARLTDGRGFDMVYDTVGGRMLDRSIAAARKRGQIINIVGYSTHTLKDAFLRGVSIHLENMSIPLLTGEGRARHGAILSEAANLVDQGKLKPLLDPHRFSFAEVADAHALFESKQHVGKIVLEAGDPASWGQ